MFAASCMSGMQTSTNTTLICTTAGTAADKASTLAKSMYEGVRQRMKQLQTDVQLRDEQILDLQSQLADAAKQQLAQQSQAHADQQVS